MIPIGRPTQEIFHSRIACLTQSKLDQITPPRPGNMDAASDKFEFLCKMYQQLHCLLELEQPRLVEPKPTKVLPIHIYKYPKHVWDLFVGESVINERNLPRYGLTYKEIEFVRNASPEYKADLKQGRQQAKAQFLDGLQERGLWVGNEWWIITADTDVPFIMFCDRLFFNPNYMDISKATLNQMHESGRLLGSNARMNGGIGYIADIWQRICILEPYTRSSPSNPRYSFLSISPIVEFFEPPFYLTVYFKEDVGWGVAMAVLGGHVVESGTMVKLSGSEVRTGNDTIQENHCAQFLAITNHSDLREPDTLAGALVSDLRDGGGTDEGAVGNSYNLINSSCKRHRFTTMWTSMDNRPCSRSDIMIRDGSCLFKQLVLQVAATITQGDALVVDGRYLIEVEYVYGPRFFMYTRPADDVLWSYVKCKCSNQPCSSWFFKYDVPRPLPVIPVWTAALVLAMEPSYSRRTNILNWMECTVNKTSFTNAKTMTSAFLKKQMKRRKRTREDVEDIYIHQETRRLTILNAAALNPTNLFESSFSYAGRLLRSVSNFVIAYGFQAIFSAEYSTSVVGSVSRHDLVTSTSLAGSGSNRNNPLP